MRRFLLQALNISSSVKGALGSSSMQRGGKHIFMPTNATLPEELPTSMPSQTLGELPSEGAGIYAIFIFSLFFHIHTIRPIPFTVYSSIKTFHK